MYHQRDDLIIACVNAGVYIITAGDTVLGDIKREYYQNRKGYREYHYILTWRGVESRATYRTLPDLCKDYRFQNTPGYNSILATAKEKSRHRTYQRRYTNTITGEYYV